MANPQTAPAPAPAPSLARSEDLPELVRLLDRTIAHLHAAGIQQWAQGHYPQQRLAGDIDGAGAWAWRQEGEIIAFCAIDQLQERQWDVVPFSDCSGRHRCLHRLFVDPALQGRGHGRTIMDWVEAQGEREAWSSIRLDAFAGNPVSNRLYRQRGYQEVGRVHFGPTEGVVYELLLGRAR